MKKNLMLIINLSFDMKIKKSNKIKKNRILSIKLQTSFYTKIQTKKWIEKKRNENRKNSFQSE